MSEREDVESWATVERSDGALPDIEQSESEVLSVPALTDETLDRIESENQSTAEANEAQRGEPGSQVECEICGRTIRVKADGALYRHRCEPKAQRGNRLENLPDRRIVTPRKVRELGITLIAYGVEEVSAMAVARPLNLDPADVPTDLPDADAMIGPPLDILWPSIPDNAQKFLGKLADNADLIDCALAWAEWVRTIGKWTRQQRNYQQQLLREREAHATSQPAGTFDGYGRVVPFSPS